MAEPPVALDAVQVTVTFASPMLVDAMTGADGTPLGVAVVVAAGPKPPALSATTLKV